MPIIAVLLGAIVTGTIYWMLWGGGMAYVSQRLDAKGEEKRRETLRRRRIESEQEARRVGLRSLPESRDGAVALMCLVAGERGELTTEQLDLIRAQMRDVLEFGTDIEERLVVAKHAVQAAPSRTIALTDLRELMSPHLTRAEYAELFLMLHRLAELHGGPTDAQERLIGEAERLLPPRR
jgi:hypothetical protein